MPSQRKSKLHLGMGMPKLFGEMGQASVRSNWALENCRKKDEQKSSCHCEDLIFKVDQPGECHVFRMILFD